jgi:prepilin-type N-terminal cleavage/methylation domain-containing protein
MRGFGAGGRGCDAGHLLRGDERGFSLVELAVVVSVVGILATVSLPSFFAWREGMELKNAAGEVASVMYSARTGAITQRRNYTLAVDYAADTYALTPDGGSAQPRAGEPWRSVDLYLDDTDPLCPPLSDQNVIFRPNSTTDAVGYEAVYLKSRSAAVRTRYRVKVLGATGKISTEKWVGDTWTPTY